MRCTENDIPPILPENWLRSNVFAPNSSAYLFTAANVNLAACHVLRSHGRLPRKSQLAVMLLLPGSNDCTVLYMLRFFHQIIWRQCFLEADFFHGSLISVQQQAQFTDNFLLFQMLSGCYKNHSEMEQCTQCCMFLPLNYVNFHHVLHHSSHFFGSPYHQKIALLPTWTAISWNCELNILFLVVNVFVGLIQSRKFGLEICRESVGKHLG